MSTKFDYLLKFIIIGDSSVGKSNILSSFRDGSFTEKKQPSIGVEFIAKNIKIGNLIFRLQIWDTAGQETFLSMTKVYYKNSSCAFIVYDITEKESFNHINFWLNELKQEAPESILYVLIGNKCDLNLRREVSYEEGENFAKKNNMMFFETSAKDGTNVEEIFLNSANEISKKISENYYDLENDTCGIKRGLNRNAQQLHLGDQGNNNRNSGGCCN